ncbi:MAG TPA: hypothetical protein VMV94_08745 [Phycisphaerae bacterium]|nr:hypothetical protein [Phycisphaerae bacterium]
MLDIHIARDRAVRRAIATGEMPNIDLIQTIQRTEGHRPCFGRAEEHCPHATCRWYVQCMALLTYQPRAGRAKARHDRERVLCATR